MKLYLGACVLGATLLTNTGFSETPIFSLLKHENLLQGETPLNLSFERGVGADRLPQSWSAVNGGYSYVVDDSEKVDGRSSARLSAQFDHPEFGALVQCISADYYLDSQIEFSGYIKTSNVSSRGYAGIWFRVDGPGGEVLAFDNMHGRGVTGTKPWLRYETTLPVSADAVRLCYGVLMINEGTAWFDRLNLEIK